MSGEQSTKIYGGEGLVGLKLKWVHNNQPCIQFIIRSTIIQPVICRARSRGMLFLEASAKTKDGIAQVFSELVMKVSVS